MKTSRWEGKDFIIDDGIHKPHVCGRIMDNDITGPIKHFHAWVWGNNYLERIGILNSVKTGLVAENFEAAQLLIEKALNEWFVHLK